MTLESRKIKRDSTTAIARAGELIKNFQNQQENLTELKSVNAFYGEQMARIGTVDTLAMVIATMNRVQVTKRLNDFHGRFQFDFSQEYLEGLSVDRLRHILFAAVVTKHKKCGKRRK